MAKITIVTEFSSTELDKGGITITVNRQGEVCEESFNLGFDDMMEKLDEAEGLNDDENDDYGECDDEDTGEDLNCDSDDDKEICMTEWITSEVAVTIECDSDDLDFVDDIAVTVSRPIDFCEASYEAGEDEAIKVWNMIIDDAESDKGDSENDEKE